MYVIYIIYIYLGFSDYEIARRKQIEENAARLRDIMASHNNTSGPISHSNRPNLNELNQPITAGYTP